MDEKGNTGDKRKKVRFRNSEPFYYALDMVNVVTVLRIASLDNV